MVKYLKEADIETLADDLRKNHGQISAPVDVIELATNEGIAVYKASFDSEHVCGMLRRENGKTSIYFNRNHPLTRQRYTIAHELGHHILHADTSEFVDEELNLYRLSGDTDANPSKRRQEIQANLFGASLLMPKSLLVDAFKATSDVAALARLFDVSEAAMGFRINALDLG